MKKIAFYSTVLTVALILGFTYGREPIFPRLQSFSDNLIEQIQKEISAPSPLRKYSQLKNAVLTTSGIFTWTNNARSANKLPALKGNNLLDQVAEARARDMFAKQYFAHVSPTEEKASVLAEKFGYDFAAIGENLALGDFENDEALVNAWLESPGHRANVLSITYLEIGIAAVKGIYEGRETWIAVQIFGKPLSVCPQLDAALRANIEAGRVELRVLENQAIVLRTQIEAMESKSDEERMIYNAKVEQYNALVAKINAKIGFLRKQVEAYNAAVRELNACLQI